MIQSISILPPGIAEIPLSAQLRRRAPGCSNSIRYTDLLIPIIVVSKYDRAACTRCHWHRSRLKPLLLSGCSPFRERQDQQHNEGAVSRQVCLAL
jgi:hypothetical protein